MHYVKLTSFTVFCLLLFVDSSRCLPIQFSPILTKSNRMDVKDEMLSSAVSVIPVSLCLQYINLKLAEFLVNQLMEQNHKFSNYSHLS